MISKIISLQMNTEDSMKKAYLLIL